MMLARTQKQGSLASFTSALLLASSEADRVVAGGPR
jgi:hypothetical protein